MSVCQFTFIVAISFAFITFLKESTVMNVAQGRAFFDQKHLVQSPHIITLVIHDIDDEISLIFYGL